MQSLMHPLMHPLIALTLAVTLTTCTASAGVQATGTMPLSVTRYEQHKAVLPHSGFALSLCQLLTHPHGVRFWASDMEVGPEGCDLAGVILAYDGWCAAGFRDHTGVHFSQSLVPNILIVDYADGTVIYVNHAHKWSAVPTERDEEAAVQFLQAMPHAHYDVRGADMPLFAPTQRGGFPLRPARMP